MVHIKIQELLQKQNKTKYWLMKETEITFQSLTDLINNKNKGIKFETLEKICKALNCTPNDIIEFK